MCVYPLITKTESSYPEQKSDEIRKEFGGYLQKERKAPAGWPFEGRINERLLLAKGVNVRGCHAGNRSHPDETTDGKNSILPVKVDYQLSDRNVIPKQESTAT